MTMVEIQAPNGKDNETFEAYIATPDDTPAAAVIMIQEIFGVNQEMRDKCEEMADQGYIAICPDLFWRIEPGIQLVDSNPEELQRAFQLFGEFNVELGVKDLLATLKYVRGLEECTGKVGCVGYCLGGKLAYMLAAEGDLDAAVSYYGVGIEAMLDQAKQITEPLLLHIAGNDEFVPKDAQEKIIEAMKDHDTAKTYRYAGMDHAFARGQGMHYNEEAARLANSRTAEFLANHLKDKAQKERVAS